MDKSRPSLFNNHERFTMHRLSALFVFLFYVSACFAQSDSLTLEQCVDIALKNNPQIHVAEGNFEAAQASFVLARSAFFPQISLQASGTKNAGTFVVGSIVRPGSFNSYAVGFQGQQLLFDFGRTIGRVSSSSALADASEQDYRGAQEDVVLNTHVAYYGLLQAQRVREVSSETVKQTEEHLTQAQAFYKVGRNPQFDVVKAEVDVANAKVNLITAENSLKLARVQLENVLGVKLKEDIVLRDDLEVPEEFKVELQTALDTAFRTRPEVIASRTRVEANQALVSSAKAAHLPAISATGGYNWRGLYLDQPLYNSWNIGLSFSVPIFEGWAVVAGVDQAKANLKAAQASDDATAQSVVLDVQQQYLALQASAEGIEASKTLVAEAEESLKLSEGRYNFGAGSPIEITDAQVTLSNARITYIQSLYNYRVARARLQRAMGIIH
jgi:outer membrane protein